MPAECIHCFTPLEPSQEDSGFCCTGCEFVYQLINNEGLEKFYDLKKGEVSAPLRDQPFQQHDFSWLNDQLKNQKELLPEDSTYEFNGSLQGISCIGCIWLVEKLFHRHKGSLRCDIIPTTGAIHFTWQRNTLDILEFAKELQQFGYLIGPARRAQKHSGEFKQLGAKLGICGAFALNAMVFSLPSYLGMPNDFAFAGIFQLITFISATLSMLVGGLWFIQRAVQGVKARVIHMDLPIALGVILAYLGSIWGWLLHYENLMYFDFVAIFIFLMLGGRWLQTSAVEKNRNRLLEQTPVPLKVTDAESGKNIEIDDLEEGASYLLPSGQTAPVSSTIREGDADFTLEWINGEPDPIHHTSGSSIPAGAINLSDTECVLTAEENWNDSLLAKLISSNEGAARSPLMEKVLRYYLSAVLILGIGGCTGWLLAGASLPFAAQIMISVFVISCPCALGVALPLAEELASGKMRTLGVFIRRPAFWSRIRMIQTIFFDKTGTLTHELPELMNPDNLHNLNEVQTMALAQLCSKSRHPLSRSIIRALGIRGQNLLHQTSNIEVTEIPGLGSHLTANNGTSWSLGKCGWNGIDTEAFHAKEPGCELREKGKLVARFTFQESLRPETKSTLQKIKKLTPHILSGDHNKRVQNIADTLNIPPSQVHSALSPEGKANLVREIDSQHSLFLGDGANDSLAFDAAFMSGAVAGRGLLEAKADFYFLSNGLEFLPKMFSLSKKYSLAVKSVFAFSLSYNLIAVLICLSGHMNPLLAAILMPLSSIASLGIISSILQKNNHSTARAAKSKTTI